MPRKIFSSKREEVHVTGEECIVRSFVCMLTDIMGDWGRMQSEELRMYTDRRYLVVQVNEDERREMHTEFW
jgi:hypothetical protein